MTFDISKVKVCPRCGALLIPELELQHAEFHVEVQRLRAEMNAVAAAWQGLNDVARAINSSRGI